MTLLRTLVFAAVAGGVPLALHADSIPAGTPVATVASDASAEAAWLYGLTSSIAASRQPELAPAGPGKSIFAAAPLPVGDPNWSLRPFTIVGESMESALADPNPNPNPDSAPPAPEPAGLFLLGTGAFATALSIRYRLFSL